MAFASTSLGRSEGAGQGVGREPGKAVARISVQLSDFEETRKDDQQKKRPRSRTDVKAGRICQQISWRGTKRISKNRRKRGVKG